MLKNKWESVSTEVKHLPKIFDLVGANLDNYISFTTHLFMASVDQCVHYTAWLEVREGMVRYGK